MVEFPKNITELKKARSMPWGRTLVNPQRAVGYVITCLMYGYEMGHDITLYPEKYRLTPDQAGGGPASLPTDPTTRLVIDNSGDVLEIAVGSGIIRFLFALTNETIRKTTGKEIPDDIQFWASLAPWAFVKAIHSLGYISLGINDHMDNPVPGMLFGQALAATVLIGTHYAVKNREQIKDFAVKSVKTTSELASRTANKTKTKLKETQTAIKSQWIALKCKAEESVQLGKQAIVPAKANFTKLKIRLTNEWNNTPSNVRTSFTNAGGALIFESLSALGGQEFLYPTLFFALIGLFNGLSHKLDPAVKKQDTQVTK